MDELGGVGLSGAAVDGLAERGLGRPAVGDGLERRLDVVVPDAPDVLGTGQGVDLGDEGLGPRDLGCVRRRLGVRVLGALACVAALSSARTVWPSPGWTTG